ncbi:ABC transporter ATP-binding protein [Sedimentibacter sp. zth1]|uniref:metal ABC transporter ATP-binding protein n=1 Tax=Sedimentibacter sp. zth1 TaxID=2816908 RepID=UPI001A933E77|nr:ABC transporter ATP-binding protein [Sedimentibacter sp. zth1]QSX05858.1 ABC transporter ATP-binding protein [Sedimentibacter sp. zth1]
MRNAIKVENLYVDYGKTQALTGVCLEVLEGEFLGVMGPNGGGKSTLLKSILGLIPISSGNISIYGKQNNGNRNMIGYVPQFSAIDKKFPITVVEVVMSGMIKGGLHPFYRYKKSQKDTALDKLKTVGIEKLYNRQISQLSGGEFQRMLIARALAVEPKILLLDEPTASVDPSSREKIYNLLEKLNENITIVLVTHDLLAISSKIKRIACINKGIVYHGEPKLTQNVVNKLYGCPVDLIAHGVPHRVLESHEGEMNNDRCNL